MQTKNIKNRIFECAVLIALLLLSWSILIFFVGVIGRQLNGKAIFFGIVFLLIFVAYYLTKRKLTSFFRSAVIGVACGFFSFQIVYLIFYTRWPELASLPIHLQLKYFFGTMILPFVSLVPILSSIVFTVGYGISKEKDASL